MRQAKRSAIQGNVTQEQLNQIIKQALAEGTVRRIKLADVMRKQAPDSRLAQALSAAG